MGLLCYCRINRYVNNDNSATRLTLLHLYSVQIFHPPSASYLIPSPSSYLPLSIIFSRVLVLFSFLLSTDNASDPDVQATEFHIDVDLDGIPRLIFTDNGKYLRNLYTSPYSIPVLCSTFSSLLHFYIRQPPQPQTSPITRVWHGPTKIAQDA